MGLQGDLSWFEEVLVVWRLWRNRLENELELSRSGNGGGLGVTGLETWKEGHLAGVE